MEGDGSLTNLNAAALQNILAGSMGSAFNLVQPGLPGFTEAGLPNQSPQIPQQYQLLQQLLKAQQQQQQQGMVAPVLPMLDMLRHMEQPRPAVSRGGRQAKSESGRPGNSYASRHQQVPLQPSNSSRNTL